ncbi:MAG: translation initiation factor IF-2 subunit beta [Haloarculaceae archaeon]
MEYETALQRAYDSLPERPQQAGDRLSVPDPVGESDGAFTRLTNIDAIASALSRDAEHLHRFFQQEFGTNGQFDGDRARYNGSFSVADFQNALDAYVAEFVTCSECGLPDTNLVTEDGIDMLRCTACGAFRPVQKQASRTTTRQQKTLEEGNTYELKIVGTGRKGDGVAEKGNYTIFVPGAREGQVVTAYIESISGNLAFARLAQSS